MHTNEMIAELASLKAQLAAATETYTAPDGEVWSPPTAEAYYLACQALKVRRGELTAATARAEAAEGELAELRQAIAAFKRTYDDPGWMAINASDVRLMLAALLAQPEGGSDG